MRHVRYGVAMSLDGFIAGPSGESDWIVHDPDIDFNEIFRRFEPLLIGRKTFEAVLKMGGGGGSMPGVQSFVISRTMKQSDHPDVTIARDAGALVADLKAKPGKDIWLFGGGELFRSLLDAGLVDGIDVAIVPVLLGAGVPLLPLRATRARLTVRHQRVYEKSGIVGVEYDVVARFHCRARVTMRRSPHRLDHSRIQRDHPGPRARRREPYADVRSLMREVALSGSTP